ncbi:DKNYY domain-containing protein [Sphingobacterium sp.]|uniref:DKNYY domain-containing protein n=1 Tax=Sphingobacterium sp. TaxID=341027 RepID=UPI0028A14E23|nr:DKNYY domain-containing protein [Sphingobacterium sp.]
MNSILKMGIISALISLLFSCKEQVSPLSEDYYKKSGAIYFIPGGNGFERGARKTVADIASFSVIKDVYARDKDHLYFMGCPQQLVDVNTFQLKNKIPIDQQHVFKFEGFASATSDCSQNQLTIIEGADPATYTTLYHQLPALAKDKTHYFYKDQPLHVDYATFSVVNSNFVKDKNQLYAVTDKGILSLDYKTDHIKALNALYILLDDKKLLYYEPYQGIGLLEIEIPSPNKIKFLNEKTVLIDQLVIISGKKFGYPEVDAGSFELLEGSNGNALWSRDKNHVYYEQQIFTEADPKTFEVLKFAVAKDAKHIFIGNKIFNGPDVKSFKKVDKSQVNHDFEDDLGNKYWYQTNKGQVLLVPVTKK